MWVCVFPLLMSCTSGTWYQRGPTAAPSSPTLPGVGLCGRLTAIAVTPGNPRRIMVGSPGGGVWRTDDAGGTWTRPQNYKLADYTILHLEWDRSTPGRLFAVTMSDLYATIDFGDHWTNLTHNGGVPPPLNKPHPQDPLAFVQFPLRHGGNALVWGRPCHGLWYSLNDGATFAHTYPFTGASSNPDNCILSVAADENDGTLYISTHGGGYSTVDLPHIFRSMCQWESGSPCLTFEPANGGWPIQYTADALVWTGSTGGIAAATTDSGGLLIDYVSTDHGSNWWRPGTPPSFAWGGGPARALVRTGGTELLIGGGMAHESPDLGATWRRFYDLPVTSAVQAHPDIRSFAWYTLAAGGRGFVWSTSDGSGEYNGHAAITRWDWTPGTGPSNGVAVGHRGIASSTLYSVESTRARSSGSVRLFAGSHDNGATCSDDRGVTWTYNGAPHGNTPSGYFCGDIYSIVAAPSDPNRVYSRNCDPGSFQRSDNAMSAPTCADVRWTPISLRTGVPGEVDGAGIESSLDVNSVIAVHPTDANFVVFANYQYVAISHDGSSFSNSAPLPPQATVMCVAIDSTGAIYAGTRDHGAYISIDGGASWSPFALNATPPAFVLKVLPVAGGTFFLATNRGVYRRRPGETAWTNVTPGNVLSDDVAYGVSDIAVDPRCSLRLYAAQGWLGSYGHHRGGVIATNNGGDTWYSITSGLDIHKGPVTYVKVDPVNPRYVYVGTWGQGAWVYDRGTRPTRCP